MGNIILIYMNDSPTLFPQIHVGLASISAYLKQKNHNVILFDTHYDSDSEIVDNIVKYTPDLIGISTTEIHATHAFHLADLIKQSSNVPIIFGGVYPSLCPEECIKRMPIQFVCIGDGEIVLDELLQGTHPSKVKGLWRKDEETIFQNYGINPVDIKKLPWIDYSIFRKQSVTPAGDYLDGNKKRFFITAGRGCAFNCSYCCNSSINKIIKRGVTYRDIDDVINEMEFIIKTNDFDEFFFTHENLLYDISWVKEFFEKYIERRINVPFGLLTRPEHININNEKFIYLLKEAGCTRIHMGVESGNEDIRKELLSRNISNKDILTAFKLCQKYLIKTGSFNIIGFPFESINNIQETYNFNVECKADYVSFSIFYPFKGSKLWDYCRERGHFGSNNDIKSYFEGSIIQHPYIFQKDLVKLGNILQRNYPNEIDIVQMVKQWNNCC